MKSFRVSVIVGIMSFILAGCGPMALLPVTIDGSRSLEGYKYFYMNAAETTMSRDDAWDFISRYLTNKGYIVVPEIPFGLTEETFIVNYVEGERRHKYDEIGGVRPHLDQYAQEVILQFISADTNDVICTIKGEGIGSTQADDIRNALQRSLDAYFKVESDDKEPIK